MSDLISRQAAIEAVHKSIFDFFDICDDDEESPMTYKDELLLELNKAITTQIKAVASAQPIEAEPTLSEIAQYCEKRNLVLVKSALFNEMKSRWSDGN